jgi:hypothetical protein
MSMTLKRGVRIDSLWNGIKLGGRPLAYGKVLAFEPDTNVPKPLWKSSDRSVPWNGADGNQVDLDAHGKALAYGHGLYQLVICDRSFVPLETWEPRFYGHDVVSARDFGAVGAGDDSIAKDTLALQSAIDHCVRTGAKLFIPAGVYKLTDTLRVYRLALSPDAHGAGRVPSSPFDRRVFAPFALEIMGERAAYGIHGNDTVLAATFADRPAIVIQGGAGVTLSRIAVEGLNDYLLEDGDALALLDDRTFVAALCRDGDNRRPASPDNAICSPYAAVVVDPYGGGGLPPDGGYPGHEDDYHRNVLPSREVTLEQCTFARFVVGVLVSPSGAACMTERVTVSDCAFERHKVAVAVCQGTSAGVVLRNVRSSGSLFFVSTCSYGDGAPSAEAPSIRGAVVESTKYLFDVNAPDHGAIVEGLACAETLGLGFIESAYGADQPTLTFVGCTFDLVQTSPAIDTHLASSASVRFVGCSFASSERALPVRFCNAGPLAFSSCAFLNAAGDAGRTSAPDPSEVCFVGFESLEKVTFEQCNVGDRSLPSQIMVLDRVHRASRMSALNRTYVLPGSLIIAADTSAAPMEVSAEAKDIPLAGVTVTRDPARPGEVTFTAPDPSVLKPGDLVFASSPGFVPEHYGTARRSRGVCGVIKGITGRTVRLASVVKSLPDGRQDLSVKYFPRLHLPSTGTTTAGSDVITDVTNARTWRQHDRISGVGIPEGAYVVDPVPAGATRLRISKPATASGNVRLYDADVTRFAEQRGTFLRIEPPGLVKAPRTGSLPEIDAAPSTRRTLIP